MSSANNSDYLEAYASLMLLGQSSAPKLSDPSHSPSKSPKSSPTPAITPTRSLQNPNPSNFTQSFIDSELDVLNTIANNPILLSQDSPNPETSFQTKPRAVSSTTNEVTGLTNNAITGTCTRTSILHDPSASSPTAVASDPAPTPPCPVSIKEWFSCLQEEMKEGTKKKTLRVLYNKLWEVVKKFWKYWKNDLKWYLPNNRKNSTDFVASIVEHILKERKEPKKRSEIPSKYLETVNDSNSQARFFYYSMDEFIQFYENAYKTDILSERKKEKPQPNDIIRLFSIATKNVNRDELEKLGHGKSFARSDLDGALSMYDKIMQHWVIQFNDPLTEFTRPDRAVFLPTQKDLDPNDPERVGIKRDYKWLGALYKKVVAEYNYAWQKWTKGTGGGSGQPENYHDWQDRKETEKYADYAENGTIDYLGYIYMLDKSIGYMINCINDPAPLDTVTEDGASQDNDKNPTTKERNKGKGSAAARIAETAQTLSNNLNTMFSEVLPVLNKTSTALSKHSNKERDETYRNVEGMAMSIDVINGLQEQINALEGCIDDTENGKKKKRRLEILEAAQEAALVNLQKFK